MQEKPDAADLLATARDVVLRELLPALPSEKALAARMVAAAIALALRQGAAPALTDTPDLAKLAAEIRAGRHDPGLDSHAQVAAFLRDYARARAAVSAPKALG
ncbi:hypothetical protein [Falsiroseomonas sp. E2-1-a4]|uniref:hypothetical protein n=1 Tax=Falsiroseomonas sp. E2-1-a4 TaxID=3239299 RepID=UPI003F2E1738